MIPLLIFSLAALNAQAPQLPLAPVHSDVRITCTPESLKSNPLRIKNVGTWNCGVTNYSTHPVIVTPAMLMDAVPRLHAIDPQRAALNVKQADSNSFRAWAMRALKYGVVPLLAFMGGGAITASKLTIAAVGAGSNVARDINDDLKAAAPDLTVFKSVIPAKLNLAAFQSDSADFSVTFTVYASKMKHAETQRGQVYFP